MTCADIMALKGSGRVTSTPSTILAFINHLEQCSSCRELIDKHFMESGEITPKDTQEVFETMGAVIKFVLTDPENQQVPACVQEALYGK